MAGLEFQILCHSIGVLSFLIACIFITTGICLQVFDPEDNTDNPLPWRTDSFALTFIGAFALIVFVVYFCHVARRQWKIFNVISIRPHYKRKNRGEVEGWHEEDKNKTRHGSEKSDDTGEVDGYCIFVILRILKLKKNYNRKKVQVIELHGTIFCAQFPSHSIGLKIRHN